MGSARETLQETVVSLTEAQAAQALDYIRRLRGAEPNLTLGSLLASDPAFHLPDTPFEPLPPVEPVCGSGIPASEMLIRDRR